MTDATPELVEPENPLPEIRKDDLPPAARDAVGRAGWAELMPVQARAIPYIMAGRDLMIQSRTGSGKTGAFLLPMIARLDPTRAETQALVLVPTRELAKQVYEEARTLTGDQGLRAVAVYGGVGYQAQLDALAAGAHIVVGTPGRVLDHLLRRSLSLKAVSVLVLDEADRMLSMGFYPDVKAVGRYLPERYNGYLFSATFTLRVLRLAKEFLHTPEFLSLSRDRVHVDHIEHVLYLTSGLEKDRALVRFIEIENPASALVFCNTKAKVHYVATVLRRFGYDVDELSSDLAQAERERVLGRAYKGRLRFLVATDVAARGIDIPELAYVVQYEPPEDPELYVHRAGRTGRAGAGGVAVTFANRGMERMELDRIAKKFNIDLVEKPVPTDEDVSTIVGQAVTATLEAEYRERDRIAVERLNRFLPLARSLADNGEGLALLAMLLDDRHQASLAAPPSAPAEDAPEGVVDEVAARKPRRRRDAAKSPRKSSRTSSRKKAT